MIRNRDFVVFSDDWGRHPFSCQHIMRHFLEGNRLLWVHTIGLRTPRLSWYDLKRSIGKVRSWLVPATETEPLDLPANLRIVSPVMLPFNSVKSVRDWNRASVVRTVGKAMEELGMRSPILLATLPNASEYSGAFGERLTVYYCVDDFVHWPGMNQPELVRAMEESLLQQADLVVVTSSGLQQTRKDRRGRSFLLPHGVDLRHFCREGLVEPPPALRGIQAPIIGFYGLLDERLDLELLRGLLRHRPGWSFVFIGNSLIPLDDLKTHPNFYHIPAVSYHDLPGYAACFNAAIIPYVVDQRTESINPLKLREYLATGKSVVSTRLPEAAALQPAVRVADDVASFARAIEQGLAEPPQVGLSRLASLRGHLWSDRAEQLSAWIEEALHEARLGNPGPSGMADARSGWRTA